MDSAILTILHIHNSRIVGGIESSLVAWVGHLDRGRFRAKLFCFEEADGAQRPFLDYLKRRGMKAHVLPWGKRKRFPECVRQVASAIEENRPCIVHTHDFRPDLVGWAAARLAECPVIGSVHAWHTEWKGVGRKREWIESLRQRVLSRFDLVVAVSEETRAQGIRRGIANSRIVTVYTGIDLEGFRPSVGRESVRVSFGFTPSDLVFGAVARLHPEKGHGVLLDAFARVANRLPSARLLIVGDGTLSESLREQSRALGIDHCVTFMGFQDDIASLLCSLDFFVLPSLAEGIPLVLIKAMAAGLPVVSSRVGGIPEILRDGESGLLVPAGDASALSDAILRLAGDDGAELRGNLGSRAREAAFNNPRCSAANSTRVLERLYIDTFDRWNEKREIHRVWK